MEPCDADCDAGGDRVRRRDQPGRGAGTRRDDALATYDDWEAGHIRADRWVGSIPTPHQDFHRHVKAKTLALRYRVEGGRASDAGTGLLSHRLAFTNPLAVDTIEVSATVKKLEVTGCDGNASPSESRAFGVLMSVLRTNPVATPGNMINDHIGRLNVFRRSNSAAPPDPLREDERHGGGAVTKGEAAMTNTTRWPITFLAALLAFTLGVSPAVARNANPGIMPPGSTPHGKSYGEWTAAWWQWAYSLPVSANPFFDEAGCANGANGQAGPVWFLTGVINESGAAERTCTVPAGKTLFFPVLNIECATLEGNGATEVELRACTEFFMSFATDLVARIDGVPIANLERYRFPSPVFTYGPLPVDNVPEFFGFDAPAGATSLAASDGFWLMLAPLSAGSHTVEFGGAFDFGDFKFMLSITYHLTVK